MQFVAFDRIDIDFLDDGAKDGAVEMPQLQLVMSLTTKLRAPINFKSEMLDAPLHACST